MTINRADGERNVDNRVVVSVPVDQVHLENSIRKEAEREAQGAEGLIKKCREGMSPLSRLVDWFRNKFFIDAPLGIRAPVRVA